MFIFRCKTFRPNIGVIILLRASEVGSPIDHLGSRQRRDTGQGSSSPLTGRLDLTDKVNLMINYQKLTNTDRLLDPFY